MLPAEQFEVIEVRPLSLNDIAIADSVRMDRRAVAAVLDVPPFVVGKGEYSEAEWNNFVNTRIRPICKAIEQELTKKLLISPDWYFRFSIRSLYSYDIRTLSEVGANLYTRGIMTGLDGAQPEGGAGRIGDSGKLYPAGNDRGAEEAGKIGKTKMFSGFLWKKESYGKIDLRRRSLP